MSSGQVEKLYDRGDDGSGGGLDDGVGIAEMACVWSRELDTYDGSDLGRR